MSSSEPLPPDVPGRPFTTREAARAGIGRHDLDRHTITRLTRGVHVAGEVDAHSLLRGLLLVLPRGSTYSCHTAARIWSLPVGPGSVPTVHIRAPSQVRPAGVVAHVGPSGDITERDGLPVSTPAATFLDLAVHLDDRWLLAVADAILRRGHARRADLIAAIDRSIRRRGLPRARRIAALVRPGVDSPMESLLRHVLLSAGLPEPVINVDAHDSHGGWIARPDLSYPERRIAIEYDGRHHFEDRRQWENDIARRHNLEDEGWVVRIATARDVFVQPDRFGADMLALWRRRG